MNFDKERENLKSVIDKEIRTLYTDERKLNRFQVEEKLRFVTNSLWDAFQGVIEPIRKKIQGLESAILVNRYKLDESLKKHCQSIVGMKRVENELDEIEEDLYRHRKDMRYIEEHCNSEEAKGDLKRLPMWVFLLLMTIVGLAEIVVYFNVFLSQEVGLISQLDSDIDRIKYYAFAGVMAVGFTVMMIWLAHKLGMMLRQYVSVHKEMRLAYWTKFIVISIIVIVAIIATVQIRGKMHVILAEELKLQKMIDNFGSEISMDDNSDSGMAVDEDVSMGDDMSMDDEIKMEEPQEKNTPKETEDKKEKPNLENLTANQIDMITDKISKMKGDLAYLFIAINLFIVVAGVFLAYEVHTSSIKYEALEGIIARLEKRRKKLLKRKKKLAKKFSKTEKDEVMAIVKEYVESVNEFDEYSQVVKSHRIAIENIYIEMIYYLLGTMEEHNLLYDIDENYLEDFTPDDLSERFEKEWKLEKVDMEVPEVMHVNNIDEFIESFRCEKDMNAHNNIAHTFEKEEGEVVESVIENEKSVEEKKNV
jgi:hypothetical protein